MNSKEKVLNLMFRIDNNLVNESNGNKVIYTAVFLTPQSKSTLKQMFESFVPDDWKWFGDHMTITLGQLSENDRNKYLGTEVELKINSMGYSDMAIAVGVDGFLSMNEHPHITLGVNINAGGKPKMSNGIDMWKPYEGDVKLIGIVREFPFE